MIKLNSLNKSYRNGNAELRVINDTSLEFDSSGFVSILGASGSGKTTLINVIGGLDKADSGQISYDEVVVKKYQMKKVDEYRRNNIGYIFQDYRLFEDETIYENLKTALEIIDVTDKEEQDKRIVYALNAVGLYKFRKKKVRHLSGGQQQRVSIARALLKNSKLIVADEPTGNLDSENAIEVMNILKKLSETTLVLLVTHNRSLADFYSTRIIEIKDGKVDKDYQNEYSGSLQNRNDKKIYLKDLNHDTVDNGKIHVDLFYEGDACNEEIKVVVRNNVIYVDSNKRIQTVSESGAVLLDEHRQELKVSQLQNINYDTSWFSEKKKKSFLPNAFAQFKEAVLSFFRKSRKGKLLSIALMLIGIIQGVCAVDFADYLTIDNSAISNQDGVSIVLKYSSNGNEMSFSNNTVKNDIMGAVANGSIEEMYYNVSDRFSYSYKYNSVRQLNLYSNFSRYPYSIDKDAKLLAGTAPIKGTVVIGKQFADAILDELDPKLTYDFLIGQKINASYTISGVSSSDTNSIYYYESDLFYPVIYASGPVSDFLYKDYEQYEIVAGRNISAANEILISETISNGGAYSIGQSIYYDSKPYLIVGEYKSDKGELKKFITSDASLLGKSVSTNSPTTTTLTYRIADYLDYTLVSGSEISSAYECLVSAYSTYKEGDRISLYKTESIDTGIEFTVVGRYNTNQAVLNNTNSTYDLVVLVNKSGSLIVNLATSDSTGTSSGPLRLSANGKDYLESLGYTVKSYYDYSYQSALKEAQRLTAEPLVILALSIVTIIYVILSSRTKMLLDIKRIGIMRSIGARKSVVLQKNVISTFVETTFTTLLGYLAACFVYITISKNTASIGLFNAAARLNYAYLGVIAIFFINVLFGMLPVAQLLRKTPAEINSKYDI